VSSRSSTPKTDARKFRSYWKQQRRLKNLETEKEIIVKVLDLVRLFAATSWGSWVIAYLAVTALDDNHLKFLSSNDALLLKGVMTASEVVQAVGGALGGGGGIAALIGAIK
jgi:hypothetical protein